jgi:hypothetical protein
VAEQWAPQFGGWDEGEIRRRMDAVVVDMKEGISMTRTEYSVLKEVLKYDECGWSKGRSNSLGIGHHVQLERLVQLWCDNLPRKIPYYRLRPIHFGH